MNDDEFFSQFPAAPRPEFADSLRAKLIRMDAPQEGPPVMNTTTLLIPPTNPQYAIKHRGRDRALSLVAALVLVIFLGAVLAIRTTPPQPVVPLAQIGPSSPAITKDNAAQLHRIDQIGRGSIYDALWTPNGQTIVMPSTAGIWVYRADDLKNPLYNISPELSIYAGLVIARDVPLIAFNTPKGVHLWDLGEQRDVTIGFAGIPSSLGVTALSPNGRVLAVADRKGAIYFYSTRTGILLSSHKTLGQRILDLEFRPDGKQVAFVSDEFSLLTLDDPSGVWTRYELGSTSFGDETFGGAVALAYSDDGTRLAARSSDMVRIWDTTTGEEISRLEPERPSNALGTWGGVYGFDGDLAFSPDGTQLITSGSRIRLWDIAAQTAQTLYHDIQGGKVVWKTNEPTSNQPASGRVHLSPDRTRLLRISDNFIQVSDIKTGVHITSFYNAELSRINDLVFSPDDSLLSVWTSKRSRFLWNMSDLSQPPASVYLINQPFGDFDGKQRLAFSPDNRFIASYLDNGDIQLWNRDGTEAQHWISPSTAYKGFAMGGFIGYSADGTKLVSKSPDKSLVWIWETATGTISQTIAADETQPVAFGALSPDGRFVALAFGANPTLDDQIIAIYDAATGQPVKQLEEHQSEVSRLLYSPDGTSLLSVGLYGSVYLWDTDTGAVLYELLDTASSQAFAFSPDGRLIAGMDGSTLVVWDASTGEAVTRLPLKDASVDAMAFSSDGTRLALGLAAGTIQLWGVDQP